MAEVTNNYINQYKTKKDLGQSFDAYWSKYSEGSGNSQTKVVMQAIYDLLLRDIRNTTSDSSRNQTIFDRIEFRDLCNVVSQILEKYGQIQESDLVSTVDSVKGKIISRIQEEFKRCLDGISENKKDEKSEIDEKTRDELRKILTGFMETFEKKGGNKDKPETSQKTEQSSKIEQFSKKLSSVDNGEQVQFKDIKETKQFGSFISKCKELFSGKISTSTSRKIETSQEILVKSTGTKDKKSRKSIWKALNPISSVSFFKSSKKNKGTGLGSIIPMIGKIHTDSANKELQENVREYKKSILSKYFKKIGNAFSIVKSSFGFEFKILLGAFNFVFAPVGKFLKTLWNGILHPIDTLKKMVNSRFVKGIFKFGLSSTGSAFMLGALCGLIYKILKKFVFPVFDKYVTIPFLGLVNDVLDWLNPDKPGTLAHTIMKIIDTLKHPIDFLKKLIKPVGNMGLVGSIIYNLGQHVGVDFPVWYMEKLVEYGPTILQTMFQLHDSPFLTGFCGSSKGSWLLTPALWVATAAGNALGKIYNKKGEEGDLTISEQIKKDTKKSKYQILKDINERYAREGKTEQDMERAEKAMDMIEDELTEEMYLSRILDEAKDSTEDDDVLEIDFVNKFTESNAGMFNREHLLEILQMISKRSFGKSFFELGREGQIMALTALLKTREKKAADMRKNFESDDISRNELADQEARNGIKLELKVNGDVSIAQSDQKFDLYGTVDYTERRNMSTMGYAPVDIQHSELRKVTLDFSQENMDETMKTMEKGIDMDSELARQLIQSGLEFTTGEQRVSSVSNYVQDNRDKGKKKRIAKFKDTRQNRAKIYKFLQDRQNQQNETKRREIVRQAFDRTIKMVTSESGNPGQDIQINEQSVTNNLNSILESTKSDSEKLSAITKLMNDTFKDCQEQQDYLTEKIKIAYGMSGPSVIVGGEPEISNTAGDAGNGGKSK